MDSWEQWAVDVFEDAELGDVRRSNRLVQMAAQAGRRPSGRISEVFQTDAERQGAYDFVESPHVSAEGIRRAATRATARECSCEPWVYVPLDGTSLKLWDGTGAKDFGAIGTYTNGATGLKLYNAIAVSPSGVPIGVAAQVWWRRPRKRTEKLRHRDARQVSEKETAFLLQSIEQVCDEFDRHAPETRCWFQIDRGGDSMFVLRRLEESGHWFTVRAQADRKVLLGSGRLRYLRQTLRREPILGHIIVHVAAGENRSQRTARFAVRSKAVQLRLRDKRTKRCSYISLNAVVVRETGRHKPIEWLLLTNRAIETFEQVQEVVKGYTIRWRIEEFHKTWKSGMCNVESTQLHSSERAIKWATILSAVAVRVERLKYLARAHPDALASAELTPPEIEALALLRGERRNKRKAIARRLSIAEAVLWLAQLGGYTGRSSGGPPGSITIARGLERLQTAAELLLRLEEKR